MCMLSPRVVTKRIMAFRVWEGVKTSYSLVIWPWRYRLSDCIIERVKWMDHILVRMNKQCLFTQSTITYLHNNNSTGNINLRNWNKFNAYGKCTFSEITTWIRCGKFRSRSTSRIYTSRKENILLTPPCATAFAIQWWSIHADICSKNILTMSIVKILEG